MRCDVDDDTTLLVGPTRSQP